MGDKKKILAIIATIILVGGLAAGWIMWRRDVTANKHDEQTQQTEKPDRKTEIQNKDSNDSTSNQIDAGGDTSDKAVQIAVQYETAARNWGLDPTIDLTQFKAQPAGDVLSKLRSAVPAGNPISALISYKPKNTAGPDALNPACTNERKDGPDTEGKATYCDSKMTSRDWLNATMWGVGSKWVEGPVANISDGRIKVSGKVRAILVQGYAGFDENLTMGQYHSITPATKDYEVTDYITVKDGKVWKVEHQGANVWWINPWVSQWTLDMGDSMNDGDRVSIPVDGVPEWDGVSWDTVSSRLKGTDYQVQDNVDTSMWDDLASQFAF